MIWLNYKDNNEKKKKFNKTYGYEPIDNKLKNNIWL